MGQPTQKLTLLPRQGRGLVSAYNVQSMGELQDSFQAFIDLHIRDSAWVSRVKDASINFGNNGPVRSMHKFNHVTQADGTVQAHFLVVAGSDLYDYYGFFNSSIINVLDPFELYFETVKNRVYFAGANNLSWIWDGTHLVPWGVLGPQTVMTYTSLGISSTDTHVTRSQVSVAGGSTDATVTWVSGDVFTTGSSWEGKEIVIDDVAYTILSVTDNHHLELTVNYAASAGTYTAFVHYGELAWGDQPPKYSYVYFNPTTGHVTNGAPVLALSEKNIHGVKVFLHNILQNGILFMYGYTKIVLFRTARDGSDLKDLFLATQTNVGADGMINNANTNDPLDIFDEQPDNQLGLVFGSADLPYRNNPAPRMRFIAYWHNRFWGIEEDRQWRLRYTGDAGSIPLGVPEECWPEEFFLDISGPDGYATGLKVIGTSLLVMTENFTFFVSGDNENTFQMERISTRGFGISQKGIDEHPGDTTTESASAIYASRDKRIWRHYAGGKIEDIGAPLQNHWDLAALGNKHPFLVKVFRLGKLWLAAVGYQTDGTGYATFFYDFDAKAWYDWGYNSHDKVYSVTSFPNIGTGPTFDGSTIGIIGCFRAADSLVFLNATSEQVVPFGEPLVGSEPFSPYTAHLKTQHLDHGDRQGKKTLESVWLFVNDVGGFGWAVDCYFDEDVVPVSLVLAELINSPRYPGPNVMCFVPREPRQWRTCAYLVTIPGPNGKLFRIESNFKNESTGTAGSPS